MAVRARSASPTRGRLHAGEGGDGTANCPARTSSASTTWRKNATTCLIPGARGELVNAVLCSRVRLQGHAHRKRATTQVTFLVIRDRPGLAQVVVCAGEIAETALLSEELPSTSSASPPRTNMRRRNGDHPAERDAAYRTRGHPAHRTVAADDHCRTVER